MAGKFPPRIFRRVPFEGEVELTYEDGTKVAARAANISLGGMFIATDEPRPVGTSFRVEFRLTPDGRPIEGRGRVLWIRQQAEGPEYPPGLGLRFLELTPGSRELIFQVVDRYVRDSDPAADAAAERQRGEASIESLPEALDEVSPETLNAAIEEAVDRQMPKEGAVFGPLDPPRPPSSAPADDSQAGMSLAASGARFTSLGEAAETDSGDEDRPVFDFSQAAPPAGGDETPQGGDVLPAIEEAFTPPPSLASSPAPGALGGDSEPAREPEPAPQPEPPAPIVPLSSAAEAPPAPAARPAAFDFSDPLAAPPPAEEAIAPAPQEPAEELEPPVAAPSDADPVPSSRPSDSEADFARQYGASAAASGGSFLRQPWFLIVCALALVALGLWWFLGRGTAGDGGEIVTAETVSPATGAPAVAPADLPEPDLPDVGAREVAAGEAGAGEGGGSLTPAQPEEIASNDPPAGPTDDVGADPSPSPTNSPAAPAPAAATALPPARVVEAIRWERDGGATVLVVQGDGAFERAAVQSFHLGGPNPREVIKLRGIVEPFAGGTVDVGSSAVTRVRTGHHVETDPDELHVVVDLTAESVELAEVDIRGDRLRLRFQGP